MIILIGPRENSTACLRAVSSGRQVGWDGQWPRAWTGYVFRRAGLGWEVVLCRVRRRRYRLRCRRRRRRRRRSSSSSSRRRRRPPDSRRSTLLDVGRVRRRCRLVRGQSLWSVFLFECARAIYRPCRCQYFSRVGSVLQAEKRSPPRRRRIFKKAVRSNQIRCEWTDTLCRSGGHLTIIIILWTGNHRRGIILCYTVLAAQVSASCVRPIV